ncbi:DUF3180 domain-containing protein [Arcanobacterium hippocoleae]|uniref:DUF3180 domain-containing protein n=1 Tax=Arcanobacterium hippocoleae TaxID=149017 RepID=UPI00334028D1
MDSFRQYAVYDSIWSFAVPLCIAGFVLWQGWLVRAYQARKRAIDPLRAGRIWLLSQAASRTGAVMLGLMCGVVCSYARQGTTAFLSTQILHFSLASFGSALLLFSGWLAERWCIVHFSDDDSGASSSGLRAESAPI